MTRESKAAALSSTAVAGGSQSEESRKEGIKSEGNFGVRQSQGQQTNNTDELQTVWDDLALVSAYENAIHKYQVFHSPGSSAADLRGWPPVEAAANNVISAQLGGAMDRKAARHDGSDVLDGRVSYGSSQGNGFGVYGEGNGSGQLDGGMEEDVSDEERGEEDVFLQALAEEEEGGEDKDDEEGEEEDEEEEGGKRRVLENKGMGEEEDEEGVAGGDGELEEEEEERFDEQDGKGYGGEEAYREQPVGHVPGYYGQSWGASTSPTKAVRPRLDGYGNAGDAVQPRMAALKLSPGLHGYVPVNAGYFAPPGAHPWEWQAQGSPYAGHGDHLQPHQYAPHGPAMAPGERATPYALYAYAAAASGYAGSDVANGYHAGVGYTGGGPGGGMPHAHHHPSQNGAASPGAGRPRVPIVGPAAPYYAAAGGRGPAFVPASTPPFNGPLPPATFGPGHPSRPRARVYPATPSSGAYPWVPQPAGARYTAAARPPPYSPYSPSSPSLPHSAWQGEVRPGYHGGAGYGYGGYPLRPPVAEVSGVRGHNGPQMRLHSPMHPSHLPMHPGDYLGPFAPPPGTGPQPAVTWDGVYPNDGQLAGPYYPWTGGELPRTQAAGWPRPLVRGGGARHGVMGPYPDGPPSAMFAQGQPGVAGARQVAERPPASLSGRRRGAQHVPSSRAGVPGGGRPPVDAAALDRNAGPGGDGANGASGRMYYGYGDERGDAGMGEDDEGDVGEGREGDGDDGEDFQPSMERQGSVQPESSGGSDFATSSSHRHRDRTVAGSAEDEGGSGPPPPPPPFAPLPDDMELANLLMAWYYAGFYTARYSKKHPLKR